MTKPGYSGVDDAVDDELLGAMTFLTDNECAVQFEDAVYREEEEQPEIQWFPFVAGEDGATSGMSISNSLSKRFR